MDFIAENIVLVALASGSATILVWPWISKRLNGIAESGPLEIVQIINQGAVTIIDTRAPEEFKNAHLSGARNYPGKSIEENIKEIAKAKRKHVVLVTSNTSESIRVCNQLKKSGIENITILAGGLTAWTQANLPTEKEK